MQRNSITQCKVCGAKEHVCFHFGVSTCRACGAFFRYFFIKFTSKFFSKGVILTTEKYANLNVNVCKNHCQKRIKTEHPKQIWQNVKNVDLINVFLLE